MCYHCGLLETSTSQGWRSLNRGDEENICQPSETTTWLTEESGIVLCERWGWRETLAEVVLVTNTEIADLLREHGGSHGYLGHEFVMSILENRKPQVDIGQALNMTVAGVVAHQSAIKDGELMKIPQYAL